MRALRRRDVLPAAAGAGPVPVSGSLFEGSWLNTAVATRGLSRLEIGRLPAGGIDIRSVDAGGGRIDWDPGSIAIYSDHPASETPMAFTAACQASDRAGLLQGGLNLGLLVLALYRGGGAGGFGYFSREFFLHLDRPPRGPAAAGGGAGIFPEVGEPVAADCAPFCGGWRNTDPDSPGIMRIDIADGGDEGLLVRAVGAPADRAAPPPEWGTGQTSAFSTIDETGVRTACLLTAYDFGFMRSELQLRISGGALVLANFNRFADSSGRRDYFTREFYRRA